MQIHWKRLIFHLAVPLAVGGVSALITNNGMQAYDKLKKPPLSPPMIVFPIAWTALYALMGVSTYRIGVSPVAEREKRPAVWLYFLQLAVNFVWSLLFFLFELRLFAFWWLLLLLGLVVWMIFLFYRVDKTAAYLQIPYAAWLLFAAYLNLYGYLLNG